MTARQLIVPQSMPSRDPNGRALPAQMKIYLVDTTTPATVYTASNLAVAHPFPITSDDAGRWPAIWAEEASVFDVAWFDLATRAFLGAFTNVQVVKDALLASAEISQAAADSATLAAATATTAAEEAQAAAAIAQAPNYTASSHSTLNIPTSFPTTVNFTLDQGGVFGLGSTVRFTLVSDPTKYFTGDITAINDAGVGTLNALIASAGGGSGSLWSVTLAASIDVTLSGRVAALETPATAAQIRAGADTTHYPTPDTLADASEPAVQSSVSGSTTLSLANTNVHHLTLTGNLTLNALTNVGRAGTPFLIRLKQDATGSRTLTINSAFKFPFSTAPTLSTTANAVDEISGYVSDASTPLFSCRFAKGLG